MEADFSQVQGEMDEIVQAAKDAEDKAKKAITDVSVCCVNGFSSVFTDKTATIDQFSIF